MNTPKIRFKGFKDDWEQRKFSELVTIERGGSPRPIDRFITKEENGLNWIKIGDAPEQGNYITKTEEKIKPEGLSKTREVHPGDLILSNSMSFGRPYILAIDGCIHDGWLAIRDTEKRFDLKFLCTLLGTDNMLSQYKAMAAGSTVNNLNKELVGATTVSYPVMDEQVKLGEFFDGIDHLITLHQRKCDETKQLKKFMLQKMFPKNGEKNPEIRFEGFTDDWEQRKLIEVCDYVDYRGKTPTKVDNGIFLVTAKNVKAGYIDYESSKEYISEDDYEEVMHRGKPEIGDVLITTEAPCGNVAQVNTSNIALAQRIIKYRGHKNVIDNTYLKHYMLAPYFQEILFEKSSGGTVQGIKGSILHQQHIIYPMYDEQLKIGEYFDSLDDLITLHQRKCEKLKELKKYMLQNMFV